MAVEPRPVSGSSGSREPSGRPPKRGWALRVLLLASGVIFLVVGSFLLLGGGPSASQSAEMAAKAAPPAGANALVPDAPGLMTPDRAVGPKLGVGLTALQTMVKAPLAGLGEDKAPSSGDGQPADRPVPTVEAPAPTSPSLPPPTPAAPPAPTPVPPAPTPVPSAPTPVPPTPAPPPVATPTPPPPPPVSPPPASASPAAVAGVSLMPLEADLIGRLNAERANAGLPALAVDADLVTIARIRSSDMAARNYFSHTSPEGQTAFTLLDQWGITYSWAGENLARNNYPLDQTVAVAVHDLMASPPHRANMLNPNYTRVGVGYAEDGSGMRYYTIVFVG
jgi:uncharacterized protein YkwD